MRSVMHISFEEFAGNLTELLDKVRADEASIVVEFASGENVLIKRSTPARRGGRKKHGVGSAPAPAGGKRSQGSDNKEPPPPTADRENVSSVGAVYDIDPNSITPG